MAFQGNASSMLYLSGNLHVLTAHVPSVPITFLLFHLGSEVGVQDLSCT